MHLKDIKTGDTTLSIERLRKDFYPFLQEDVALQRYSQLLSDFITSLADVEAFERNVTSRKSLVSMVKNVTKWLMEIQKKMKVIAKVSSKSVFSKEAT